MDRGTSAGQFDLHLDLDSSRICDMDTLGHTPTPLEMTMGMGFPMGIGIPWDSHGNGNW